MSTFITFPVASTNIFPISNSKAGGQLVTEYNLRSLDTVGTPSAVKYSIGPSYVHSMDDFHVSELKDNVNSIIDASCIQISPGKGIINGHFVETFAPMVIDLLAENNRLSKKKGTKLLSGKLAVGIRAVYSTDATIAGSLKVENKSEMYEGLEVVILPEADLKLPTDVPTSRNDLKAHIKLATFTFLDGIVSQVVDNPDKVKYIEAERISNIGSMIDDTYIKKSALNRRKLYAFSGKGVDDTGKDTWCDATGSLMMWDSSNPQTTYTNPNEGGLNTARFSRIGDSVELVIPHMQVDGMVDASGKKQYYAPVSLSIPAASYSVNTPGVVNRAYTAHIKSIAKKLNNICQTVKGKQIQYLEIKNDDTKLPTITSAMNVGDYVLVNQDYTAAEYSDGSRSPSTMYVIIPGIVKSIKFVTSAPKGLKLGEIEDTVQPNATTGMIDNELPEFFTDDDQIRGTAGSDYFVYVYRDSSTDKTTRYYYAVDKTHGREWSDFIMITRDIQLAQEDVIGGFYNIPINDAGTTDAGYVYLDDDGHLRLYDYGLLRSGTLAYQLGEDVEISKGESLETIQAYLDEYVNERVVFPTDEHIQNNKTTPNIVHVKLPVSKTDDGGELYIRNIDSRFGGILQIDLSGDASNNVTIHITDCEKVKISTSSLTYANGNGPVVSVTRCGLYYDASAMDYIRRSNSESSGMQDISLWYEKFTSSDADLMVEGMTVRELNAPILPSEIDFWNTASPNDNHYHYALESITFSNQGDIIGCGIYVSNDSTNNIDTGHKLIYSSFTLPYGSGLFYPKSCLTSQIKITGTFVSAYLSSRKDEGWIVTDTNFTALTNSYTSSGAEAKSGSIAFHVDTNIIAADLGVETITEWEAGSFHRFAGGVVS